MEGARAWDTKVRGREVAEKSSKMSGNQKNKQITTDFTILRGEAANPSAIVAL
jgi:hypothetical protein